MVLLVVGGAGALVYVGSTREASTSTPRRAGAGLPYLASPSPETLTRETLKRDTSLLDPTRLALAFSQIKARAGSEATITLLRIDRDQVWAVVVRGDGAQRVIRVPRTGRPTEVGGGTGPSTAQLSLARLDPQAPQRILAAFPGLEVDPAKLDHLAVLGAIDPPRISVFLTGGTMLTADLDGSDLRRGA